MMDEHDAEEALALPVSASSVPSAAACAAPTRPVAMNGRGGNGGGNADQGQRTAPAQEGKARSGAGASVAGGE